MFILIFSISAIINADDLDKELNEAEAMDTGWVSLDNCIIHLKNGNKLIGKVRMRFNYPIHGINYKKGFFLIQKDYNVQKLSLKNVKKIRLDHVRYPYKGKIVLTAKSGKEYPLKNYIVSREPIQYISPKGILSLRFRVIKFIERQN